jgi:inosose dehydratase
MLDARKIKIAAQPIIWSNDDFHDLGGKTPLETCLGEMREAGYAGTELGHKFPKDARVLKPILNRFGLELVSGWHSTYLATRDLRAERADYLAHLDFLSDMGCAVVIAAECSGRVYNDPSKQLDWAFESEPFSADEQNRIHAGLDEFARLASDRGMKLVYHHHMGTGIQNLAQIDRLLSATQDVWLLGDTGHLAFAGESPRDVFVKYASRIGHVHLKNVRTEIVARARKERQSFDRAVRDGVFTVPGDGGIDYLPIFEVLQGSGYSGWMVVEAEQDPEKANPFEYAKKARAYIRSVAGV